MNYSNDKNEQLPGGQEGTTGNDQGMMDDDHSGQLDEALLNDEGEGIHVDVKEDEPKTSEVASDD